MLRPDTALRTFRTAPTMRTAPLLRAAGAGAGAGATASSSKSFARGFSATSVRGVADHYAALNLPRNASRAQIKARFYEVSLQRAASSEQRALRRCLGVARSCSRMARAALALAIVLQACPRSTRLAQDSLKTRSARLAQLDSLRSTRSARLAPLVLLTPALEEVPPRRAQWLGLRVPQDQRGVQRAGERVEALGVRRRAEPGARGCQIPRRRQVAPALARGPQSCGTAPRLARRQGHVGPAGAGAAVDGPAQGRSEPGYVRASGASGVALARIQGREKAGGARGAAVGSAGRGSSALPVPVVVAAQVLSAGPEVGLVWLFIPPASTPLSTLPLPLCASAPCSLRSLPHLISNQR